MSESILYALLLLGCFSAYQSISLVQHSINSPVFMSYIRKLVQARDIQRAVKLSSAASDSALGRATKIVLIRFGATTDKTADELRESCGSLFQSSAENFRALGALHLLDGVAYLIAAGIFVILAEPPVLWQGLALGAPGLAFLWACWTYARVNRDLKHYNGELAALLASNSPDGQPYR